MFKHNFVNLPNLETVEIDGRRHYITPNGAYPSITTVLSAEESIGIKEWKSRVGEVEATRISKIMARRGTNLHTICERYLRNESNITRGMMPDVLGIFNLMKPSLARIDEIWAIEAPLYSDKHQIAGRSDTIGLYKNTPSIIDFKTTNSDVEFTPKKIEKYFVQCKAYADMYEDRTGTKINQGVLIIGSNDFGLTTYISSLDKYFIDLEKAIKLYREKYSNA